LAIALSIIRLSDLIKFAREKEIPYLNFVGRYSLWFFLPGAILGEVILEIAGDHSNVFLVALAFIVEISLLAAAPVLIEKLFKKLKRKKEAAAKAEPVPEPASPVKETLNKYDE